MANSSWQDLIKDASEGGANFAPLPDGDYDLKVIEASSTTTATGKTMFKITAEVQTGPHAKRRVWDNLVVSPDSPTALGFFFRKMKALGLDTAFFQQGPSDNQVVASLNGRVFRGKIITTRYNDKDKNEIKEYHPAQAGAGAPGFAPAPAAPAGAPLPQQLAPAPAAAPAPPFQQPAAPVPGQTEFQSAPSQIGQPAPAPAPAPPAPEPQQAPPVPAAQPASPWDTPGAAQAPNGFQAPPPPAF